ncbi:DUF1700 domain-containing protein [Peptococcus simiae]|uniref:DUF1700 domain-containing protein n=1 Tax=Peptococcus simiae TaxID=1643805 RepID=A0ABW9H2Q5_9FIRM
MTKATFLARLNNRLQVLNKKEREDILNEYAGHIDMKLAEGLTEDQAIAGFGDFDDLVEGLLEAYHVDPGFATEETDTIGGFIRRFGYFLEDTLDALLNLDRRAAGQLIAKGVILLVIVLIIAGGLETLFSPLRGYLYGYENNPLGAVLISLTAVVLELLKLAVAIYAVYFLIKHYLLPTLEETDDPVDDSAPAEGATSPGHPAEPAAVRTERRSHRNQAARASQGADKNDPLIRLAYFTIKALVFIFILLPALATMLSLFVVGVLAIAGLAVGLPIWGPTLLVIGIGLLSLALVLLIWHVIYADRKFSAKPVAKTKAPAAQGREGQ